MSILLVVLNEPLNDSATASFEFGGEHYVLRISKQSSLSEDCAVTLLHAEEDGMKLENACLEPKVKNEEYDVIKGLDDFALHYCHKDFRMVNAMVKHFKTFVDKDHLACSALTPSFCQSFWHYLRQRLHGNTPANYFKKFKGFITSLHQDGLIQSNPTQYIRLRYTNYREKHPLCYSEIKMLEQTVCDDSEVKRAFLFSCFSGLRWCDVTKLTWANIDYNDNRLQIVQSKVEGHSSKDILTVCLGQTAMRLLGRPGKKDEKVFNLPLYHITYRVLQSWRIKANLSHSLSFHCARHTFITNLVSHHVDIKTVARLAGHSTTKHTERYIHEVDENIRLGAASLDDYELQAALGGM